MFKPIPGNAEYKISIDGKIVDSNDREYAPLVINGKITIEMYGKVVSLCKEWLASISHFEVNLPKELLEFLPEIEFKTVGNKILKFKNNLIMT